MNCHRTVSSRSRCGFTLVELLVVIGIIALLISILLPTLGRAQDAARTTKCLSNMRQVATAVIGYASENDSALPYQVNATNAVALGAEPTNWFFMIDAYMDDVNGGSNWTQNSEPTPAFQCPSAVLDGGKYHYSAPGRIMTWISVDDPLTYKITRSKRSSETMMMVDGVQQLVTNSSTPVPFSPGAPQLHRAREVLARAVADGQADSAVAFYNEDDPTLFDPISESPEGAPNHENINGETQGYVRYRHQADTAANLAFLDGHAETRKVGEIFNYNVRPDR
ncbi:MAG: type II secretion system protein [Planctomycetota bacterium]